MHKNSFTTFLYVFTGQIEYALFHNIRKLGSSYLKVASHWLITFFQVKLKNWQIFKKVGIWNSI